MDAKEQARRAAFKDEALVHIDALYGVALRLIKNERDAEDLVQDTYLKAYNHFDKYEPGTNCKAWLFKILTNTFINRYRKKQKERVYLADDDERPLYERHAAPPASPMDQPAVDEEHMFHRLFGDEVRDALELVPEDFRLVVLLADLQDFSYKEIADIMDCPIGTVMSRLYRGRRLLQKQLVEYAVQQGYLSMDPREGHEEGKLMSLAEYRRTKRQQDEEQKELKRRSSR
jgi:RNA polymerase sigma-70 factor (ECF subfamily)